MLEKKVHLKLRLTNVESSTRSHVAAHSPPLEHRVLATPPFTVTGASIVENMCRIKMVMLLEDGPHLEFSLHGLDALPGMTILSACLETVSGGAGGYSQAENHSAFVNQTSWEHAPVSGESTNSKEGKYRFSPHFQFILSVGGRESRRTHTVGEKPLQELIYKIAVIRVSEVQYLPVQWSLCLPVRECQHKILSVDILLPTWS